MTFRSCLAPLLATAFAAAVLAAAPSRADTIERVSVSTASVQADPLLFTSKNWAGYAAETDFSNPVSGSVTAVSATWIVPKIKPSPSAGKQFSNCAVWVGMDGFDNQTVEQVGTESYVLNGSTLVYAAWYEMYPGGMWMVTGFGVSAGNSVTASVQYDLPGYPDQFQLSLTNNTTGKSFTIYEPGAGISRTSAEWIVEAPTYSGGIVPLPIFNTATFTSAQATIGSTTGAIDDPAWQVTQVNMNDAAWGDAMSPSSITTVGSGASAESSFTVIQAPEPSALASLAVGAAVLALRVLAARRKRPRLRTAPTVLV